MHDWCSAAQKDHRKLESQVGHLHWELTNSYQGVGIEIGKTSTAEDASKAFGTYLETKK
jgi:hypothetical protein